jgi:MFS family permease
MATAAAGGAQTLWTPLRLPIFRALWLASMVSSIGTWMQTVGAQWLLVDQPNASLLVSLVQTAETLPVVLVALPAGVFADLLDRRRMLIGVQSFQVVVGVGLTAMTVRGELQPTLLLTFTFLLGMGAAMQMPAWQALIPELVPRAQLPGAAALGSININIARAIGPAIAGLLITHLGVAWVFALNCVSFALFGIVLLAWRRPASGDDGPDAERFLPALRAGGRYVRNSPVVRRILLRLSLFVVPANVLWALLPLLATRQLGLDSSGYGLLLAALGIGSIAGAFSLPRLRVMLSTDALLVVASLGYGLAVIVLALTHSTLVALPFLLIAGGAWITVLANLNAVTLAFLPGWVRARALSVYQIVMFGSMAAGALLWGVVGDRIGLTATFLSAGALLVVGGATVAAWPLVDIRGIDSSPGKMLPDPQLVLEPADYEGLVLVQVTYIVEAAAEEQFLQALATLRRSRLRTGASSWSLYRHGEAPDTFVEQFVVPSWDEHLRQHSARLTTTDQRVLAAAAAFSSPDPVVAHLLTANLDR